MAICMPLRSACLVAVFAIVFAGPVHCISHLLAAETPRPIAMETKAVTLELVCRDGAESGTFHPIHARMLEANTLAGAPRSEADLNGYSAVPRGARARSQPAAATSGRPGSRGRRRYHPGNRLARE